MADNVEIEFTEQNPTIVEVLVENTVTNIDVTVEAPTSPQVIEVHVDVNSAQVAIDAAAAAEAILQEMQDLISDGIPTATSTIPGLVLVDEDVPEPTVYLKSTVDDLLSQKLNAADYNDRFKGKHTSLANLQAAHPVAYSGCYATVDPGSGVPAKNYNWDDEEGWVLGSSASPTTSDELTEGAINLFFTAARALAAVPNATSLIAGLSKLYPDLLASNVDGSVTQAAIVAALSNKQNSGPYLKQVADFPLINTVAMQRMFSGGENNDGAVPIFAGTTYLVYFNINVIDLPAIAKTISLGFLGTSVASDLSIFVLGVITNNTGTASITMARVVDYGGAIVTQSSAANFGRILGFGVLECSQSGTLIPSFSAVNSGFNGAKTKKNSVFTCFPLGPNANSYNV